MSPLTRSVGSVTSLTIQHQYGKIISTHTLRGERDNNDEQTEKTETAFQLTRSVGSVTVMQVELKVNDKFQLTRSVGSVTCGICGNSSGIPLLFQLTRSVGSVTKRSKIIRRYIGISTHTLRGERDDIIKIRIINRFIISTHTLRGERDNLVRC